TPIQYAATGHYSDGSTQSLTSTVTWSSSNNAFVTINSSGLATPVSVGNTTIQAALGGVSRTAQVRVVPPLAVNTAILPLASVSQSYNSQLQAMGGTPPYFWTVSSGQFPTGLSPGLSLASDGTIKGVPTQAGQTSFNVKMTDTTNQSGTFSLPLTISASNFDGPAELPRVFMDTSMPAQTGANTHVLAGQNLQNAIN